MPDQITTEAELEDLLCGLNEDGHEPYLLVVDSRPKPALVWLREAASEEVQAGVTIGEPGLKHFTDGLSRNQTLDWLKYPVTVLYRPDAPPVIPGQNPGKPTAETVADALIRYETGGCCGFGTTCGLCDCGRSDQTAEQRREWDEHQLDRARAVLALIPPQRCAPSEDEIAEALHADACPVTAAAVLKPIREQVAEWREFTRDPDLTGYERSAIRMCASEMERLLDQIKAAAKGGE